MTRELDAARRSRKGETIRVSFLREELEIIDAAAGSQGKTREEFIVDAARQRAEEALLDWGQLPHPVIR